MGTRFSFRGHEENRPRSGPDAQVAAHEFGGTLLEQLIVVAIIAILAAIGVPVYQRAVERAEVAKAESLLKDIGQELVTYRNTHGHLPATLSEIGRNGVKDPWGHEIRYLRIDETGVPGNGNGNGNGNGGGGGGNGQLRKNRNLVPINSLFDLYSVGRDGLSAGPLTAKHSLDDIVWANDGGFIGMAREY